MLKNFILIYFIINLQLFPETWAQCPNHVNWHLAASSTYCYYVDKVQTKNWDDNKIFCESLGGGTVKIRTSTDQSDVETLLNQKYNPNVNIGYWLGTKYFSDVSNSGLLKKNRYDDKTVLTYWKTTTGGECNLHESFNILVNSDGSTIGQWVCDNISNLNGIFCQKNLTTETTIDIQTTTIPDITTTIRETTQVTTIQTTTAQTTQATIERSPIYILVARKFDSNSSLLIRKIKARSLINCASFCEVTTPCRAIIFNDFTNICSMFENNPDPLFSCETCNVYLSK